MARTGNRSLGLIAFSAAVAGVAWFGSRHSPRDLRTRLWYDRLEKPPFNPPKAVFPIAWTLLYTLVAVSGWRVWLQPQSRERSQALRLWVAQLLTNAQWTKLFFKEHLPAWSLADIVSLEVAVVRYIVEARKVDKPAAAMFLPYAAWVAFAMLLNEEIVRRNRRASGMFPHAA